MTTMAIEIDDLFFIVHKRANHVSHNNNTSRNAFHNTSLNHRNPFNNYNSLNQRNNQQNNSYASKHSNNYKNPRNSNYRTHQFNHHKKGNLFSNNSHSSSSSTSGQTAFTAASPMELGAINEYKPLSASVKDFRRASGLCMYCVEANHQVSSCPKKRKKAVGSLSTIVLPE